MLNFGESVAVAIISAVVAFFVSLVFRWLDRERPVWRVTTTGFAEPAYDGLAPYLFVEVTNIGNGAAYDAELIAFTTARGHALAKPVLGPGEVLTGYVRVPVRRQSFREDPYGGFENFALSGHELKGLKLEFRYRRPPLFSFAKRRLFALAPLVSDARKRRNATRKRRAVLQRE